MKLEEIVKGYEKKYGGGEPFFNAIDEVLQCEDIYQRVYGMIKDPHRYTFILTGEFGVQFHRWILRSGSRCAGIIRFPGGLRDGRCQSAAFISPDLPNRWTSKACFIDDSYFSGTTRATCLHVLYVPKDIPTFVAYDGSHKLEPWVHSLYRYHPNEGPTDLRPAGGSPISFADALSLHGLGKEES